MAITAGAIVLAFTLLVFFHKSVGTNLPLRGFTIWQLTLWLMPVNVESAKFHVNQGFSR